MNKHLKTFLILLGMIAFLLLFFWGVDDGWIHYPIIAIFIAAIVRYIWFVADELRKIFFKNEDE